MKRINILTHNFLSCFLSFRGSPDPNGTARFICRVAVDSPSLFSFRVFYLFLCFYDTTRKENKDKKKNNQTDSYAGSPNCIWNHFSRQKTKQNRIQHQTNKTSPEIDRCSEPHTLFPPRLRSCSLLTLLAFLDPLFYFLFISVHNDDVFFFFPLFTRN